MIMVVKVNKNIGKASPNVIIDDAMIRTMEIMASKGLNIDQIAATLGFSRATLYRKKRDEKKIETAIKRGREQSIGLVVNKLFDKAMAGDNVAMIFYLKNKDPDNWADKQKHDHDITSGGEKLAPPKMVVEYVTCAGSLENELASQKDQDDLPKIETR